MLPNYERTLNTEPKKRRFKIAGRVHLPRYHTRAKSGVSMPVFYNLGKKNLWRSAGTFRVDN
jgi:hypothetical protein